MAKPRIKADEIAHRAMRKTHEVARRADETARMSQRIADRARLDMEIRFAKTQFFAVGTASLALLGAILSVGRSLDYLERQTIGVIAAASVAIVGISMTVSLQEHLANTRLQIDASDGGAYSRGSGWVATVKVTLFVSALVVIHLLCVGGS